VRLEGLDQLKNPVTSLGIEPMLILYMYNMRRCQKKDAKRKRKEKECKEKNCKKKLQYCAF
jgi:hypothetical protein